MTAPQQPSVPLPGKRGYARYDEYEAHRCKCGHIVYLSDQVGGRCQFCACDNHRPAGDAA